MRREAKTISGVTVLVLTSSIGVEFAGAAEMGLRMCSSFGNTTFPVGRKHAAGRSDYEPGGSHSGVTVSESAFEGHSPNFLTNYVQDEPSRILGCFS